MVGNDRGEAGGASLWGGGARVGGPEIGAEDSAIVESSELDRSGFGQAPQRAQGESASGCPTARGNDGDLEMDCGEVADGPLAQRSQCGSFGPMKSIITICLFIPDPFV